MSEPERHERTLLDNHHAFTARYRGEVIPERGAVRWASDVAAFSCLLLESPEGLHALDAEARAVRTFPWSEHVGPELERRGFRRHEVLRYMRRTLDDAAEAASPERFTIQVARAATDIARFSEVQCRAFLGTEATLAPLRAFLHAANARNLGVADQSFYIGCLDNEPVAVTLMTGHERAAGIYAVATLPEHRSRGFSRALLARAMLDARQRGCDLITLQVHRGTAAERLYTRLGFSVAFDCTLWTRNG